MIKIEAITLEEAYSSAALKLECSITELQIEVVQTPSSGFLGLFKKKAIIVAVPKAKEEPAVKETPKVQKQKVAEVKVEKNWTKNHDAMKSLGYKYSE